MCFIVYSIPSLCGMFVYREVTSIEASMQSFGRAVVSSRLMKSVVSLMNDGSVCTYGCSQVSLNLDIFSVMLLQLDTISLMLIGFLCIFFRKYNREVLCFLGGLQYSICIIRIGWGSLARGILGSLSCVCLLGVVYLC